MKGRGQQRLPIISDPSPDDWGDGSWTVDCVCGVTFDDGEEMVNCDDCGVWVHTRCSRFVKGEKSFVCDKCKIKKGRGIGGDYSEETEVARLLVELPTKTMQLDSALPGEPGSAWPPFKRRLWTDIPMEECVHVNGVPGGDPSLFEGLSSVFSPQLWKCTGYVPKKFNFQYKEFPCWEEDEGCGDKRGKGDEKVVVDDENENPADRGADVLFSLSKEILSRSPQSGATRGLRGYDDGGACERKLSPKEVRRKDWGKGGMQNHVMNRERSQLRQGGIHVGKRKKDELGVVKEQGGRKKSRIVSKEFHDKKRGMMHASDGCKLDVHENGGVNVRIKTDSQGEDGREALLTELNCEGPPKATVSCDEPKPELFMKEAKEVCHDEAFEVHLQSQNQAKTVDQQASVKDEFKSRNDSSEILSLEMEGTAKVSSKEEDARTAVDDLSHVKDESHYLGDLNGDSSGVVVDSKKSNLCDGDRSGTVLNTHDGHMSPGANGVVLLSSTRTSSSTKLEENDGLAAGGSGLQYSVDDEKPILASNFLENSSTSDKEFFERIHNTDNLSSVENTSPVNEKVLEANDSNKTAEDSLCKSREPHHCDPQSEVPVTLQEDGLKSKHSSKYVEELSKPGSTNSNPLATSLRKTAVVTGKSTLSSKVSSRSSVSPGNKSSGTPASSPAIMKPTVVSKQRVKVKSSTDRRRDGVAPNVQRDESKREVPTSVKDRPRSPAYYVSKLHQSGKSSHSSVPKNSSDMKEQLPCPSKSPTMQNVGNSLSTVEITSPSHNQSPSQNKGTAPSSYKTEKLNHTSSQSLSKMSNHSISAHSLAPGTASPALSDEELALLLHQELNSSPRVPRVPRVRQTGSIHHLSSQTSGSMLAKRASSSAGKDHISASRRKSKEEASRDNTRNARELADETRRTNKLSSPDHKYESVIASDVLAKRDSCHRSPDASICTKKNTPLPSNKLSNSGPSSSMEANDQTLSSIRSSPRDTSDDDTGDVSGSMRTLPGLIDEILSKGKRMSYEELCDAVLPHWQSLRKHNGERYAYSSHSQAVLDCLRNRSEWVHLVDRGPKTNSIRKKRKLDADTSAVESDNEDVKGLSKRCGGRNVKPRKDEYPKGKRNARMRRRLQLQGRTVDARKRQKADAVSDDDFGMYSSEDTESVSSEDENMGARTGDETSSSSDEEGMV